MLEVYLEFEIFLGNFQIFN